ncbi:MAG: hypothetical protein L3J83_12270, partial [Proteobacteria bacterium]|nr:hypothetical protein [Pseudomonadota bacterium]
MIDEVRILPLIEQRKNYPVNAKDIETELNYFSSVLDSSKSWTALVIPSGFLLRRYGDTQSLKGMIFDDWFISGIFDLSAIWQPYASIPFTLLLLEHERPKSVLFSLYTGTKTFSSRARQPQTGVIGPQTIEAEYSAYINKLETFIKTRKPPQASNAKFFTANFDDLDLDRLHGNYYDPELIETERKIQQETFAPLSQVAQVLIPRKGESGEAYVLKPKDFRYPINIKSLAQSGGTNIVLQRNDIVVTRDLSKAYLVLELPKVELTPSLFTVVVRPNTEVVLPEYLCLYFQSDVAKNYS